MGNVEFEVGQKYKNMKGSFEVLSVDQGTMRIRWESGEEITTSVDLQTQIITRMNREQTQKEKKKK